MKAKKIISFSLLFSSLFVLVACGGGENPTNPTTIIPSQTTPTTVNPTTVNPTTTTTTTTPVHVHNPENGYHSDVEHHWHACQGCDEHLEEAEHNFNMSMTKAPSCEEAGVMTYTCSVCNYSKTAAIEKTAHTFGEAEEVVETNDAQPCKTTVKLVATCSECGEEHDVSSTEFEHHDYSCAITTPATCSAAGTLTYTCKHCNKTETKTYTDAEAHVWNEGTKTGNVIRYDCTLCNATKSVIDAKEEVAATVTAEQLGEVAALELKNATIELDTQTLAGITGTNVEISADTVAKADLQVADEVKERIGDNKVYDFSMAVDGNNVTTFGGKVTVTLPYELSEGEDPDNIAIWYLSGEEPTFISAKYSNGFVTFETEHFSLYTIVKMSKAEACRLFGHNYLTVNTVDPTCLSKGYEVKVCQRCGETTTVEIPKTTHKWEQIETVTPTKFNEGYSVYKCEHCGETKLIEFPKLVDEADNAVLQIYSGFIAQLKDGGYKFNAVPPTGMNMETYAGYVLIDDEKLVVSGDMGAGAMVSIMNLKTGKASLYMLDGERAQISNSSVIPDQYKMILQLVFGNAAFDIKGVAQYFDNDKLNDIAERIFQLFFKVEEVNGKYEATLDGEKVAALFTELKTITVEGLFNKLFGDGAFAAILEKLTAYKDMTVAQIIADLKTEFVDIDGLINFAFALIDYINSTTDMNLPIDKETILPMITQFKEMKVDDILTQFGVPMTLANIVTMVEGYKDTSFATLLNGLAHFDITQLGDVTPFLSLVSLKFTTTKELRLDKVEASIDASLMSMMGPTSATTTGAFTIELETNTDKTSYKTSIEKVEREMAPVTVTLENNAWFTDLLKGAFGEDVTFTVGKDADGNIKVVSSNNILMQLIINKFSQKFDDDKLLAKMALYRYAKIEMTLNDEYGRTLYHNPDLDLYSTSLNAKIKLFGVNTGVDPELINNMDVYNYGFSTILYDKKTGKKYLATSNVDTDHLYKYTLINESDIPDGAVVEDDGYYGHEDYEVRYIYIKAECLMDIKVRYIKVPVFYLNGEFHSMYRGFNTRFDFYQFTLNNEVKGKYVQASYDYNGEELVLKLYGNLVGNKVGAFESTDQSVKVEVLNPTTEGCLTTTTYKLTIAGKEFTFVVKEYDHQFGKPEITEVEGACLLKKTYTCSACGHEKVEFETNHHYVETVVYQPTNTQDGVVKAECSGCHETYYMTKSPQLDYEVVLEDLDNKFQGDNRLFVGYCSYYNYEFFNDYGIVLTVGTMAEDNQVEVVEDAETLNSTEFEYQWETGLPESTGYATINARLVYFDGTEVARLREGLTEGQFLMAMCVNNYGSTVGALVFNE